MAVKRSLDDAATAATPAGGTEWMLTVLVSKIAATSSELSMLIDLVNEPGRAAALLAAHPGQGAGRVAVLELSHGRGPAPGITTRLRTADEARPAGRGGPDSRAASLRIGVLGQLTINGQPGALLPAQTQLIVALAVHGPAGLPNRQLCDLLGTDSEHPKPADSLGSSSPGPGGSSAGPTTARSGSSTSATAVRLHQDSRVDWQEFETLTDEGIAAKDAGKLAAALSMIRGQPFTGCYYWWLDIELVDSVGAKIVAAATRRWPSSA